MLSIFALTALLNSCAPMVAPHTMESVITVESGGQSNAIGDNTSGRSYFPSTKSEAISIASYLLAQGHSLDMGLSQVNSANIRAYGLSLSQAFDPCWNVHTGGAILQGDYVTAMRQFGPGQVALVHAIGAYNTGSIYAGAGYASKVVQAAFNLPIYVQVASRPRVRQTFMNRPVSGHPRIQIIESKVISYDKKSHRARPYVSPFTIHIARL